MRPSSMTYSTAGPSPQTGPGPALRLYHPIASNTSHAPISNPASLPSVGYVLAYTMPPGPNTLASSHLGYQSVPMSSAQRPGRIQRRTDPSCDACRKRKVRCDATEISNCTECSSNNVKCQFTQKTNKRVHSMKYVQDLERRLEKMREENSQLEKMREENRQLRKTLSEQRNSCTCASMPAPSLSGLSGQLETTRGKEIVRVGSNSERANIREFSQGIVQAPHQYNQSQDQLLCTDTQTAQRQLLLPLDAPHQDALQQHPPEQHAPPRYATHQKLPPPQYPFHHAPSPYTQHPPPPSSAGPYYQHEPSPPCAPPPHIPLMDHGVSTATPAATSSRIDLKSII